MIKSVLFIALLVSSLMISAFASTEIMSTPGTTGTSVATTPASTSAPSGEDVYDQLISISGGKFTPQSAVISNGSYTFNYGSGTTSTFLVEAGWGIRILHGFYIQENIAYSRFSGNTSTVNTSAAVPDSSLSVNLLGIDSRLSYSLERFPLRWFIPFVEGGYQYTLYSQTGSSDVDSVQGGTGNFVAGAGVRLWINRAFSLDTDLKGTYTTIPVFLSVKWNRIYPNSSSFDLANSSIQAGVSVGL